jgi:hypothetical protein
MCVAQPSTTTWQLRRRVFGTTDEDPRDHDPPTSLTTLGQAVETRAEALSRNALQALGIDCYCSFVGPSAAGTGDEGGDDVGGVPRDWRPRS